MSTNHTIHIPLGSALSGEGYDCEISKKHPLACCQSDTVEWYTPQWFFDMLNAEHRFTLDPCAISAAVAKCPRFYTPEDDGLSQDWEGERVFGNFPYGRGQLIKWIKKAYYTTRDSDTLVVAIIPCRPNSRLWRYVHGFEVIYPNRRVPFVPGKKTKKKRSSPAHDTAVVIYRPNWGRHADEIAAKRDRIVMVLPTVKGQNPCLN